MNDQNRICVIELALRWRAVEKKALLLADCVPFDREMRLRRTIALSRQSFEWLATQMSISLDEYETIVETLVSCEEEVFITPYRLQSVQGVK